MTESLLNLANYGNLDPVLSSLSLLLAHCDKDAKNEKTILFFL